MIYSGFAVGADAEDDRIELLLTQIKGKDITELIACGREKLSSVPSGGGVAVAATGGGGGGGAAAAAPVAAEAKKEEKVEEKEESDDVLLLKINRFSSFFSFNFSLICADFGALGLCFLFAGYGI